MIPDVQTRSEEFTADEINQMAQGDDEPQQTARQQAREEARREAAQALAEQVGRQKSDR